MEMVMNFILSSSQTRIASIPRMVVLSNDVLSALWKAQVCI
jgi:hypothetical protein